MTHIIDNTTVENVLNIREYATPQEDHTLTAGTLTLTNTSAYVHRFTGITAGQIIQFSAATTYPKGWRYYLINADGGTYEVRNGAGTQLVIAPPFSLIEFYLADNSTTAGIWERAIHSSSTFQGVAMAICSYGGQANTGRYLEFVSGNSSDTGPFVVVARSFIVALSVSANASTTGTISVYKSTDLVNPIASVTCTNQLANYVLGLNTPLLAGDLLSIKVASGSFSKPFVTLYFGG